MENLELVQMRWVQGWHMNANGHLFGGQLLCWIDEDTMMLVSLLSNKSIDFATAGMERVRFYRPILQGDRLRFFHRLVYAGKTSLWVYSETFVEDDGERAFSSYTRIVSTDAFGKPKLLKHIVADTILEAIPKGDQWRFVELLCDLHRKEVIDE